MRTAEQVVADLKKAQEEEKRAAQKVAALTAELMQLHKFLTNQIETFIGPVA